MDNNYTKKKLILNPTFYYFNTSIFYSYFINHWFSWSQLASTVTKRRETAQKQVFQFIMTLDVSHFHGMASNSKALLEYNNIETKGWITFPTFLNINYKNTLSPVNIYLYNNIVKGKCTIYLNLI